VRVCACVRACESFISFSRMPSLCLRACIPACCYPAPCLRLLFLRACVSAAWLSACVSLAGLSYPLTPRACVSLAEQSYPLTPRACVSLAELSYPRHRGNGTRLSYPIHTPSCLCQPGRAILSTTPRRHRGNGTRPFARRWRSKRCAFKRESILRGSSCNRHGTGPFARRADEAPGG
jgi:hypothetical protein